MRKLYDILVTLTFYFMITTNIYKSSLNSFFPIDLTLFFVSCILILLGMSLISGFKFKKKELVYFLTYIFLIILYAFTFFYTPSRIYSLIKFRELIIILVIAFSSIVLLNTNRRLTYFLFMLFITGSFLSVGFMYNLQNDLSYVTVFGLNYLVYSRYILISLLIGLWYFKKYTKFTLSRVLLFILILIDGVVILQSGAFSSTASLIIIMFYVIVSDFKINGLRSIILIFFSMIVIVALYLNGSLDLLLFKLSVYISNGFGGGRQVYWRTAYFMILEKPLMGWGIGSFAIVFNSMDVINYPHNIILELWSEAGLIMIVTFCLILMQSFRKLKEIIDSSKKHTFTDFVPTIIFVLMLLMTSSLGDARIMYVILSLPFILDRIGSDKHAF